jgi:hypothetical protein
MLILVCLRRAGMMSAAECQMKEVAIMTVVRMRHMHWMIVMHVGIGMSALKATTASNMTLATPAVALRRKLLLLIQNTKKMTHTEPLLKPGISRGIAELRGTKSGRSIMPGRDVHLKVTQDLAVSPAVEVMTVHRNEDIHLPLLLHGMQGIPSAAEKTGMAKVL